MNRKNFLRQQPDIYKLYEQIEMLKHELSGAFREEYARVLPFNELLFDRWEKAEELGFGKGTSIYNSSIVIGDVTVGSNTWIGPNTILDGSGKLSIGDYCSISANVQLYSHDTVQWAITGGKSKYEYAETKVGNNCYIGPNCVIAKGVTIGDQCIVGANSFVDKNFKENSRIVGNPAKKIL